MGGDNGEAEDRMGSMERFFAKGFDLVEWDWVFWSGKIKHYS